MNLQEALQVVKNREKLHGFSWVIEGKIGGMKAPIYKEDLKKVTSAFPEIQLGKESLSVTISRYINGASTRLQCA